MAADPPLSVLRAVDPAARLAPLAEHERLILRDQAMFGPRDHVRRHATAGRRAVRTAIALAVLAVVATGVAWAAGGSTPLELFQSNPQGTEQANTPGAGPGWDQTVVPGSVKNVGSVDIPKVGPVSFWHAATMQGGWCAGLRLPNGDWLGGLGTASSVDGGGTVPGCFPTQASVIDGPDHVVKVSHGFDWETQYVDARSVGGRLWDIRYGEITAPGAVKVTDIVSGATTDVVDGNLFLLSIPEPNPPASTPNDLPLIDLVAYDQAGNVVANSCPYCSGG
jgi:hypothetical protein